MSHVGRGSHGTVFASDGRATKVGRLFKNEHVGVACIEAVTLTSLLRSGETHPGINGLAAPARSDGDRHVSLDFPLGRKDLGALMRDTPADARRALARGILVQLAAAVNYLHGRGFVHGDLKPANVIVMNSAGPPQVRVIDFGSACWVAGGAEHQGTCTYAFAAPELFAGHEMGLQSRSEHAARQTDAFSIGMIVLTFVSGRYVGRNDWDFARFKAFHENDDVREEAHRYPVPPEVFGLLEKDPARRTTVAALHTQLADVIDVTAERVFPRYRGLRLDRWPDADARATAVWRMAAWAEEDAPTLGLAVATMDRFARAEDRPPTDGEVRACFVIAVTVVRTLAPSCRGLEADVRYVLERLGFDVLVRTAVCDVPGVAFGRLCDALIVGGGSSSRTLACCREA